MPYTDKAISKLISYWLRHHPEDGNLTIDQYGSVNIDQLLNAISSRTQQPFDIQQLLAISLGFDKVRWDIDIEHNTIRATHGHSIPVILGYKEAMPPAILYHGTAEKNIALIKAEGIKTMSRQFVHLSANTQLAKEVAQRHGKPSIISIQTAPLIEAGWIFYNTSDNVWLTNEIPVKYLQF